MTKSAMSKPVKMWMISGDYRSLGETEKDAWFNFLESRKEFHCEGTVLAYKAGGYKAVKVTVTEGWG